jgi:Ca2+-binding EF-hand superfamily protein
MRFPGEIDAGELQVVMQNIGETVSPEKLEKMIS